MSRCLVVTAIDIEARGLARHLGLARVPGRTDLRYRGPGLDLACVGPRALHLARLGDLVVSASLVVSAGTCGALAPQLEEGDLVIPDTVLTSTALRHALWQPPGLVQAGALLTVDRVVETAEAKARLRQDTGAVAVDMESAIIVAWAQTHGLPAIVIRGVVDTAVHGVSAALAGVVDRDGRTRATRAMRAVLGRPLTLPRALALRRGTGAALRSVATAMRALGATSAFMGRVVNDRDPSHAGGR